MADLQKKIRQTAERQTQQAVKGLKIRKRAHRLDSNGNIVTPQQEAQDYKGDVDYQYRNSGSNSEKTYREYIDSDKRYKRKIENLQQKGDYFKNEIQFANKQYVEKIDGEWRVKEQYSDNPKIANKASIDAAQLNSWEKSIVKNEIDVKKVQDKLEVHKSNRKELKSNLRRQKNKLNPIAQFRYNLASKYKNRKNKIKQTIRNKWQNSKIHKFISRLKTRILLPFRRFKYKTWNRTIETIKYRINKTKQTIKSVVLKRYEKFKQTQAYQNLSKWFKKPFKKLALASRKAGGVVKRVFTSPSRALKGLKDLLWKGLRMVGQFLFTTVPGWIILGIFVICMVLFFYFSQPILNTQSQFAEGYDLRKTEIIEKMTKAQKNLQKSYRINIPRQYGLAVLSGTLYNQETLWKLDSYIKDDIPWKYDEVYKEITDSKKMENYLKYFLSHIAVEQRQLLVTGWEGWEYNIIQKDHVGKTSENYGVYSKGTSSFLWCEMTDEVETFNLVEETTCTNNNTGGANSGGSTNNGTETCKSETKKTNKTMSKIYKCKNPSSYEWTMEPNPTNGEFIHLENTDNKIVEIPADNLVSNAWEKCYKNGNTLEKIDFDSINIGADLTNMFCTEPDKIEEYGWFNVDYEGTKTNGNISRAFEFWVLKDTDLAFDELFNIYRPDKWTQQAYTIQTEGYKSPKVTVMVDWLHPWYQDWKKDNKIYNLKSEELFKNWIVGLDNWQWIWYEDVQDIVKYPLVEFDFGGGSVIIANWEEIQALLIGVLEGNDISGSFGWVRPVDASAANVLNGTWFYNGGGIHLGADYSTYGRQMNVPIRAAGNGIILFSANACDSNGALGNKCGAPGTSGGGNQVYLLTEVDGQLYVVKYLHMYQGTPIATGMIVNAGDTIGGVGNSGNSSGPHVHVEVIKVKGSSMEDFVSTWNGDLGFGVGWAESGLSTRCDAIGGISPCRMRPELLMP